MEEIVRYMSLKDKKVQDESVLKLLQHFIAGRRVDSAFLLGKDGSVLVTSDTTLVGSNFSFRNYFMEALDGKPYEEILMGSVTKKMGAFNSYPVKSESGEILGVVVVKGTFKNVEDSMNLGIAKRDGYLMLVDDHGVVVHTNKPNALFKSLAPLSQDDLKHLAETKQYGGVGYVIEGMQYPVVLQAVRSYGDKTISLEIDDKVDGEIEIFDVVRIGNYNYFLVSEVGMDHVISNVRRLSMTVIGLISLAVIIGSIVRSIAMGRLMAPLSRLEDYVKKVAAGDLKATVSIKTSDEIETLADNVKKMVRALNVFNLELEKKVEEQTKSLKSAIDKAEEKNIELAKSRTAMLNLMEDINDEKESISREKNKIETILSSIADGVFVVDKKGEVVMVNKVMEGILGKTRMQIVGLSYKKTFVFAYEKSQGRQYPNFVEQVLNSGKSIEPIPYSCLVVADGRKLPITLSCAPVTDYLGNVIGSVVVLRDNTRERELEKSKDEFLSVASHQLRTPLGSMRWNAEMLLGGDLGDLTEEAKMVVEQIHEGNVRLIGLVNDLLDVSRIDQGRVMNQPELLDVNPIILSAAREVGVEAERRNIKIRLHLSNQIPHIMIDPRMFREVVENLISNAVKYNKAGGKVDVKTILIKGMVKISFKDNGIGIDKSDMGNLFNKFYRAKTAVESETEGSGLGLFVVKKYVESWGGEIHVKSSKGKGSEFIITLPKNIKYQKLIS